MKSLRTLLLCMSMITLLSVPAFATDSVRLAYVEWDCATTATNVAKVLLEEAGYEVEILPVAAAAMWQAVGSGDVDGLVAAWLPVTHGDYLKRVGDKVENLGPNAKGAKVGWVVPQYVTIDSIEEMTAHAEKFGNKIIGIDPGAGLMRMSEETISAYGLDDFELMEGSGATMTAAIGQAIKEHKWIVATGWSPHWKFGRWELKYLKDPKGTLGGEETINTIVRKNLKAEKPEVYAILDRYQWESPEQFQMVMNWNQEKDADPYQNAKRFFAENPAILNKWLGK